MQKVPMPTLLLPATFLMMAFNMANALKCHGGHPGNETVVECQTKCAYLANCRIGRPIVKGCVNIDLEYYDYGETDPCLMEIPHSHGKTAKEVCGTCDICDTDLCNHGKSKKEGGVKPAGAGSSDEAASRDEAGKQDEGGNTAGTEELGIKCHDPILRQKNQTDCYPGTTGCIYRTGCHHKGVKDWIGCDSEDQCDSFKMKDGKTFREVCDTCYFCTTDMCNSDADPPNGAAGIVGWDQTVIIPIGMMMMTLLLGAGIRKMLII